MTTKHTPGRLNLSSKGDGRIWIEAANETADDIAVLVMDHHQRENAANAARIVACWNACDGINPEAVPALLAACRAAKAFVGTLTKWANSDPDQQSEAFALNQALAAAIARAEGGAA